MMEVTKDGETEVTITGHIKTIEDYQKIKQVVNPMVDQHIRSLTVRVPESLSMTSSVIGYLLKLVYENNIVLQVFVKDERLLNLLEVLNLVTVFNVKKM